jgi:hypothetical protein
MDNQSLELSEPANAQPTRIYPCSLVASTHPTKVGSQKMNANRLASIFPSYLEYSDNTYTFLKERGKMPGNRLFWCWPWNFF